MHTWREREEGRNGSVCTRHMRLKRKANRVFGAVCGASAKFIWMRGSQ